MDYNRQVLQKRQSTRANGKCRVPLNQNYFHEYLEQSPIGEDGVYIMYMRSNIKYILEDSNCTNMFWTKIHAL